MYGSLSFLPPAVLRFLSSDFFFETTHIEPKVRSLISFDKYSQVLKSVVVYLCSFSDLSCMLMKQNVNNDASRNLPHSHFR